MVGLSWKSYAAGGVALLLNYLCFAACFLEGQGEGGCGACRKLWSADTPRQCVCPGTVPMAGGSSPARPVASETP